MRFLLFTIEDQYYAIELSSIKSVIWSVAITPLSHAGPAYIAGFVNVHGDIMPVINMRQILHHPSTELALTDKFIITQFNSQSAVLWVDNVKEVKDYSENQINVSQHKTDSSDLSYIIKDEDKIIYAHDWEKLLKIETLL